MPPRPVLISLLALLAAACPGPVPAGGVTAVVRPLSADAPPLSGVGAAEVLGVLELQAPGERWFGGLSGMVMEGDRITAVNDAGHWVSFRLATDADGRPVDASDLTVAPLGGLDGSKADGDAEELASVPGGLLVAFERRHRLMLYPDGLAGQPRRLHAPQGLARLPANGGAEAVAALADGRLLVVAEEGAGRTTPAWIGRPGEWRRLSFVRAGDFHPTAAVALPDGDVLILERRFSWIGGVAARLIRVSAADLVPGATVQGGEIAVFAPPLLVDNYEAMVVRARADGHVVAYLLSDDNFNPLQATLLMAVLLP